MDEERRLMEGLTRMGGGRRGVGVVRRAFAGYPSSVDGEHGEGRVALSGHRGREGSARGRRTGAEPWRTRRANVDDVVGVWGVGSAGGGWSSGRDETTVSAVGEV